MSWLKYKLVILLSLAVVIAGVSMVLTQFNHMIRPAGPVIALDLKGDRNGAYQVDFLGETFRVDFPVNLAGDLLDKLRLEYSKNNMAETCRNLLNHGEQGFKRLLSNLSDAGGRVLSEAVSRAGEIINASPWKEWFSGSQPGERK